MPPAERPETVDSYWDVVRTHGGVPVEYNVSNITLIGRLDQNVRIRDLRVVVDRSVDPLTGGLLCTLIGGADEPTVIARIDLDLQTPRVQVQDENGDFQPFNASRVLTLARKDQLTINLTASTTEHDVSYHLEIDYIYGDSIGGSVSIDDDGQPFRVTAPLDLASYARAWVSSPETGDFDSAATVQSGERCIR